MWTSRWLRGALHSMYAVRMDIEDKEKKWQEKNETAALRY